MTKVPVGTKVEIYGKVFRAKKKKPSWIPARLWCWAKKKSLPGTGKWEKVRRLV